MRSSCPWVRFALISWGCLIVFSLTFASDSLAADKTSDYLIVLDHPDPDFGRILKNSTAEPVRHSGALWLARITFSQLAQIQQLPSVKQVLPAAGLVLEIDLTVTDLPSRIETLGGIVVQKYENMPMLSVFVPMASISEVRQLPGVKRVRKQKIFIATDR